MSRDRDQLLTEAVRVYDLLEEAYNLAEHLYASTKGQGRSWHLVVDGIADVQAVVQVQVLDEARARVRSDA